MNQTGFHDRDLTPLDRMLNFFAYDHLPDFLQSQSAPFAVCAEDIANLLGTGSYAKFSEPVARRLMDLAIVRMDEPYRHENIEAVFEITSAARHVIGGDLVPAMRCLLRAKDCAVRAALP